MTIPMIGTMSQCPPNQLCTIEYHNMLTGKNKKPRMGHRIEGKTPLNQLVKSHNSTMVTLGKSNAPNTISNGIYPPMLPIIACGNGGFCYAKVALSNLVIGLIPVYKPAKPNV